MAPVPAAWNHGSAAAARVRKLRYQFRVANAMIAWSISSPPTRMDWEVTTPPREITATLVVPPPTFSGRTATMLPGRPADHLFRLDASIGWRWGGWLSSIEDYQYCSRSGR